MLKKLSVVLLSGLVSVSAWALEVNKATAQELTQIKGIGPAVSERIVAERKKGDFKNWDDLVDRVSGVGMRSAEGYAASGLTVEGKGYPSSPGGAAGASKPAKPALPAAAKK